MAGMNSRFEMSIKLTLNGFLLQMLRSLRVYLLKQLFSSISVNSDKFYPSISEIVQQLFQKLLLSTKLLTWLLMIIIH